MSSTPMSVSAQFRLESGGQQFAKLYDSQESNYTDEYAKYRKVRGELQIEPEHEQEHYYEGCSNPESRSQHSSIL